MPGTTCMSLAVPRLLCPTQRAFEPGKELAMYTTSLWARFRSRRAFSGPRHRTAQPRRSRSLPMLHRLEDRNAPASITTLASFDNTKGAYPYTGGLVQDSSGNLFGTAFLGGAYGYGTVFEVVAGSGTITRLASFNIT